MLGNQTMLPDIIELVNHQPKGLNIPDITERYRIGYDKLRNQNLDCIFLIENDDWYAPDYIEIMVKNWILQGKPDLFGTTYTIYYHIRMFSWFLMEHHQRSSAMSTLIKPDLNFNWCADSEIYTDIHLWNLTLTKKLFTPSKNICIGIKHGIGMCGGKSHVDRLERYLPPKGYQDHQKVFLNYNMDAESFNFYSTYFTKKYSHEKILYFKSID